MYQPLSNCIVSFFSDSLNEDLASEFGDSTIFYDWKECSAVFDQSILNESVIVSESLRKLSDSELRKELQKYGEIPGPIMPSTRNVYIKRLARLHSGATYSKVIFLQTVQTVLYRMGKSTKSRHKCET